MIFFTLQQTFNYFYFVTEFILIILLATSFAAFIAILCILHLTWHAVHKYISQPTQNKHVRFALFLLRDEPLNPNVFTQYPQLAFFGFLFCPAIYIGTIICALFAGAVENKRRRLKRVFSFITGGACFGSVDPPLS